MSHATWYARGLGDGAAIALGLPAHWPVTAILAAGATTEDYATYARARVEAQQRTRKVIERRRRDAEWNREMSAFLAAHRIGQELRWLHTDPLRLVTRC